MKEPCNKKWIKIEPLGGGGQGDTFLVKSVGDEPKPAVLKLLKGHKVQDAKARRRMYQEVANLKILRSVGGKVPEVLDGNTESFEDTNVAMYFVMEHIEGNTLANAIKPSDGLPAETSIGIALELCSTVRVAVKEGIVHRDIKPENIIVRSTAPPDVVMVDFGLSFNEDEDHNLTSADESLDNKFLSLPERRGPDENKRDPRSDLTGICAILHYCLTKCIPRNLRDSQGIDELTNRLEEILKPGSKETSEDLEMVLIRETTALRKNNRATQLNEYYKNVLPIQQSMLQCINEIQARLQKHRDFFYLLWENNLSFANYSFQKPSEKAPQGDLVASNRFGCRVFNLS